MTDQELALIEAIRDAPDDDAVRLVYADWLEEAGQAERAELIRLQLYLDDEKMTDAGLAREKELTDRLRAGWPASLADAGLHFRRGVAVANWTSLEQYRAGTAALEQAGDPDWVVERRLKLGWESESRTKALFDEPSYGRLTRLDISIRDGVTVATARWIASSPHSAGLRHLSLSHAGIRAAGAKALARSPHLRKLRALYFYYTPPGAEGIEALANSRTLNELRELSLCSSAEGEEALALAAGTGLPRLTLLNLGGNRVGDARLRQLLKASWVPRLRTLILHSGAIRDNGAKALAECEALAGLKSLNLNSTQLGDAGAIALLESPHLRGLEELSVGFCRKLTKPVRERIRRRFGGTGETGKGRADDWAY